MTEPHDYEAEDRAFRKWSHARSARLRLDLTEEQKLEALRIGRIQFKSAGAKRER